MFSISQEAQATVVLTDSFASWGTFPRGFNPEGRPVTSTVNALEQIINILLCLKNIAFYLRIRDFNIRDI